MLAPFLGLFLGPIPSRIPSPSERLQSGSAFEADGPDYYHIRTSNRLLKSSVQITGLGADFQRVAKRLN